ncbi:LGFP repeat-containing protein [Nocardia sp. NPDC127579]|uniref:LGFP repeat-containing protein n=1 Tax=Nocardia sp. NPDC127579 TaxID=3345402 RepID=UPI003641F428
MSDSMRFSTLAMDFGDRKSWRARGLALGAAALLGSGALLGAAPFAHAQDVSSEASQAIDARYTDFGGAGSFCGQPTGAATTVAGGAMRGYQGCNIYYSADTGAKVMYGDILAKYQAVGGPEGSLGFPTNDESGTGDGLGRFNNFAAEGGAAIYWGPDSGAHVVEGKVLDAWRTSGGVAGPFGYPTADVTDTNGVMTGMFAGPGGTEIQWSEADGTVTVPPELAATLPGFKAPAAPGMEAPALPQVPNPDVAAPTVNTDTSSGGINRWWAVPIGLAITAAAGALLGLMGRRPATTARVDRPMPVRPATPAARPAAPRAPEQPRYNTSPPRPAPNAPRPEYKAPRVDVPKSQPWSAARPAYEAPKPPTGPRMVEREHDTPMTAGRHAFTGDKRAADTEMTVTYENNAVGANQRSWEDKSDTEHNR